MKWIDFKAEVLTHLTSDAERQGLEHAIPLWIEAALSDLQDHVVALQAGHETIMGPDDFVDDGECSRGLYPEGMVSLQEMWLIEKDGDGIIKNRWLATGMDWSERINYVEGRGGANLGAIIFADPQGYSFMFWPNVDPDKNYLVSIMWNGKKTSFQDEEETLFDHDVAIAVADYVQARIERKVNRDLQQYASFMQGYAAKRRMIFSNSVLKKL